MLWNGSKPKVRLSSARRWLISPPQAPGESVTYGLAHAPRTGGQLGRRLAPFGSVVKVAIRGGSIGVTFSGRETGSSAARKVVGCPLPIVSAGAHLLKELARISGNAVAKELAMRTLSSIAEHQMVAAFLLAERTSPDFGPGVEHFRSRLGIPEHHICR